MKPKTTVKYIQNQASFRGKVGNVYQFRLSIDTEDFKGEEAAELIFGLTNCPFMPPQDKRVENYHGPSMSVGDIAIVEREGEIQIFKCLSTGWQQL